MTRTQFNRLEKIGKAIEDIKKYSINILITDYYEENEYMKLKKALEFLLEETNKK